MLKKQLCNKKGETLVIVVIIAVILLIVGGAMMGFAANNMHATSQDAHSRGVSNISKATGKVITDSMEGGQLGKELRDKAIDDIVNNCTPIVGETRSKVWEFTPTIDFDSSRLNEYKIKDVKISYISKGTVTTLNGSIITGSSLSLENIKVKYTVEDSQENDYTLSLYYSYNGWYSKTGLTPAWTNEIWKTEKVTN